MSIDGEDTMGPPIEYGIFKVPPGFIAYNLPSSEPTYILPWGPIAGADLIGPPV
jgi:hypothetical protein